MASSGQWPPYSGRGRRGGAARKAGVSIAILVALTGFAILVAISVSALEAREHFSALEGLPDSRCDSSGEPPPRPLELVRQRDIDGGLIHHILRQRATANRFAFILRYHAYSIAIALTRDAGARRRLFAKLPCGVRPRLLKRLREA